MTPEPLILIVDDVSDGREMYVKFLEFNGLRAITAADGESALRVIAEAKPNLVVMDLGLPRMDGWEVIRRLKADPETRAIPVIALSAHVFADSQQRARLAGCDSFLMRPCLPEALLAEIRLLLSRSQPTG